MVHLTYETEDAEHLLLEFLGGQITIGPMEDVNVPNVGETQNHPTLKNASPKKLQKNFPKRQTTNQEQATIPVHSRFFLVKHEFFKAFPT